MNASRPHNQQAAGLQATGAKGTGASIWKMEGLDHVACGSEGTNRHNKVCRYFT